MLIFTLAIHFLFGVLFVRFTKVVDCEAGGNLGTRHVIITTPERLGDLDEFVLFALNPTLLTFTDNCKVLQRKETKILSTHVSQNTINLNLLIYAMVL